jgi:hypothetical protein
VLREGKGVELWVENTPGRTEEHGASEDGMDTGDEKSTALVFKRQKRIRDI